MNRRLARLAEWLAARVAPRVDPAWLAAAERARIEQVTGRPLEAAQEPARWIDPDKWDAAVEPPVPVRETSLSDDERAAWAEIVAHWVQGS